ncbi:MAG: oxalurate catabolism protein HpxZ [Acidimicrobiales bacterium]
METDRPDVVAEIAEVFARYETALVANDLAVLDELFWDDERTVRFGFGETLIGHAAVSADRRSRERQTSPRALRSVTIATFGPAMATVNAEFVPHGTDAVGRQSQTWVRFDGGWRVVSAHVSWEGGRAPV